VIHDSLRSLLTLRIFTLPFISTHRICIKLPLNRPTQRHLHIDSLIYCLKVGVRYNIDSVSALPLISVEIQTPGVSFYYFFFPFYFFLLFINSEAGGVVRAFCGGKLQKLAFKDKE
jgi:hypothetical protein